MKNKIINVCASFLLIGVVAIFFTLYVIELSPEDEACDETIQLMNGDYPSTIFVYGDDVSFGKDAPKKNINGLSDGALQSDSEYNFLVVNNLEDKIAFSDEDWETLQRYVLDGSYSLVYLGKKYLTEFKERGYLIDASNVDCGFALRHYKNRIISTTGIWTESENEIVKNEINHDYLEQSLLPYMKLVILGV